MMDITTHMAPMQEALIETKTNHTRPVTCLATPANRRAQHLKSTTQLVLQRDHQAKTPNLIKTWLITAARRESVNSTPPR